MTWYDYCCTVNAKFAQLQAEEKARAATLKNYKEKPVTQAMVLAVLKEELTADIFQRWLKEAMVSFANQVNKKIPREAIVQWRRDNSEKEAPRLNEGNMVKGLQTRLLSLYGTPELGAKAYTQVRIPLILARDWCVSLFECKSMHVQYLKTISESRHDMSSPTNSEYVAAAMMIKFWQFSILRHKWDEIDKAGEYLPKSLPRFLEQVNDDKLLPTIQEIKEWWANLTQDEFMKLKQKAADLDSKASATTQRRSRKGQVVEKEQKKPSELSLVYLAAAVCSATDLVPINPRWTSLLKGIQPVNCLAAFVNFFSAGRAY